MTGSHNTIDIIQILLVYAHSIATRKQTPLIPEKHFLENNSPSKNHKRTLFNYTTKSSTSSLKKTREDLAGFSDVYPSRNQTAAMLIK